MIWGLWYVWQVIEKAKLAAHPRGIVISNWMKDEKAYLLSILHRIVISPVLFYVDDITDGSSDKVQALIDCLLFEKQETEANESYSSLIFVQR